MAHPETPETVLKRSLDEHQDTVRRCLTDKEFLRDSEAAVALIIETLRGGRRVFLCGNGGSAADAQHIAAEFEGHFRREREPVPVLALTTNTSSLTAIGNDYGYDHVFARQIRAHGRSGDVLVAISTSGNSPNILAAVDSAKRAGMKVVGLTGVKGGKLAPIVDVCVRVPSDQTPRIQEIHILFGHAMCAAVDEALLGPAR